MQDTRILHNMEFVVSLCSHNHPGRFHIETVEMVHVGLLSCANNLYCVCVQIAKQPHRTATRSSLKQIFFKSLKQIEKKKEK